MWGYLFVTHQSICQWKFTENVWSTCGTKYSRMYQVKFAEDSLYKVWRDMVCLSHVYHHVFWAYFDVGFKCNVYLKNSLTFMFEVLWDNWISVFVVFSIRLKTDILALLLTLLIMATNVTESKRNKTKCITFQSFTFLVNVLENYKTASFKLMCQRSLKNWLISATNFCWQNI